LTQELNLMLQRKIQEAPDALREGYLEGIRDAHNVYKRQMIVLIATYIENILIDFMECTFTAHPSRMYEYLNDGIERHLKGKVDLKEILESGSIETLVERLASRSASIATGGKFCTALNNLERITKSKLESKLTKDLLTLVELRNRIVHEASQDIVTYEQVRDGFEHITALLKALGNIATSSDIPIHDPAGTFLYVPIEQFSGQKKLSNGGS